MQTNKRKKQTIISLVEVGKDYTIRHHKPVFLDLLKRFGKKEKYVALNNINLDINPGERVGIIGPNGAGKTTLLKLISGITVPSRGEIRVGANLVSLIDLEAGFHPDLTGTENIFLNGMVIGMKKNMIEEKYNEIVNFADIGGFIDAPLYTYSQGMKLRLGFSIAIHADPEILILDEGFSAGDAAFQKKLSKRLKKLIFGGNKRTIIIVSHWMDYLRENVQKIIWIDKTIIKSGGLELLDEYESFYKRNS